MHKMGFFNLKLMTLIVVIIVIFVSAVNTNSIPDSKDESDLGPPTKDAADVAEKEDEAVKEQNVEKIEEDAEETPNFKESPTTKVIAAFMGKDGDASVLYVDYGEKVGVTCGGDGDPAPFLRWYRRRTDIRSTWERVATGPFATLEILQDGVYVCTARNVHNDFYDTVSSEQLTVRIRDHAYPHLIVPDFEHSERGFEQSMDSRRPDNIHAAYLDSTIVVGVVLSLTIIILLAVIVVSYCKRGKRQQNPEAVFQGQPPKYFGTNNDGYVPLRADQLH